MACISHIASYLPETILPNSTLTELFPEWPTQRIEEKTGIAERHLASPEEYATDLAVRACQKLFASQACQPSEIDFMLVCTQTPEFLFPNTASLLQARLGLPHHLGAFDFNLGCSGYVYGLGLAEALLACGQARCVLLVTTDTYSKLLRPEDKNVRTLFGDGATATLLRPTPLNEPSDLGPFVYGTDGGGTENLICRRGGVRHATSSDKLDSATTSWLYMNGPEIFNFTLRVIPDATDRLLRKAEIELEQIDFFVFHQANAYMLEHLRKKLGLPQEKFYFHLKTTGNTVSSTIPLALENAHLEGRLKTGDKIMLAGFGVGYSWATTLLRWRGIGSF